MEKSKTGVKERYWQIIRGLCILAVIMIHCPSGTQYGTESLEFKAWLAFRQIINFPVAIFVFMAGYFVNIEKCTNKPYSFLSKRGGRLLVPFFVWSLFYSFVTAVLTYYGNGIINWKLLFFNFFLGKASPQLYFILVMLQFSFITPYLIRKIMQNSMVGRLFFLITPCYLAFIYLYVIKTEKLPPFYATVFLSWFVFYYIGLQIKIGKMKDCIVILNNYLVLTFALIVSTFEAFMLMFYTGNVSFSCSQLHFSNFFLVLVLVSFFYFHKDKVIHINILESIGDCSYGIFFVHIFIIMFIRMILKKIGLDQFYLLYYGITFLMTAFLSFMIVKHSNKFLRKTSTGKKILSLLGFV